MSIGEIKNLTVTFGAFRALNGLSLTIPSGCTGLLGPNGAGKTTLIKTILGFLKPTSGEGQILGHSISSGSAAIRQLIGYMPEQDCHIPGMSAVQFTAYAGQLAGLPAKHALRRAHEVLEYCGLGEARYRQVETYSTGMKQRIKLAQALVQGPKLLLLDEPTNGLDPRGREEMLELIRSISLNKDVHVVVSSHLLKDIERTCDQVVVVLGGQLRAAGTIRDLKLLEGQPLDLELREPVPAFETELAIIGFTVLERSLTRLRVEGPGTLPQQTKALFAAARKSGGQIRSLIRAQRSLEDAFLEVIRGQS